MSFLVLNSRPFCNLDATGHGTLEQIRQGWAWDGVTFPQLEVFGSGTQYPVGLTFEQMQRWYWALDEWQMTVDFEVGTMTGGVDDGPFTPYSIAYNSFPDGGSSSGAVTVRSRIPTSTGFVTTIKDVGGGDSATLQVSMAFADILFDPIGLLYYPKIVFQSSLAGGGRADQSFANPTIVTPDAPTGINLVIDDQTGTMLNVPLYRGASPGFTGSAIRVTATTAKPTVYPAT